MPTGVGRGVGAFVFAMFATAASLFVIRLVPGLRDLAGLRPPAAGGLKGAASEVSGAVSEGLDSIRSFSR